MSISEQVKELRELSESVDEDKIGKYLGLSYGIAFDKAADTIEALSAKLAKANMERSERFYKDDILTEILNHLDKRIGTHLKIIAGLNDETQRYGYAKALDAYQQIKTYVEITIEEYKEKRSDAHYGGGWIPCSERLPEERDSIFAKFKGTDRWNDSMFEKISSDVIVKVEDEAGNRMTMVLYTTDGKWAIKSHLSLKVIAWQPLPE